MKKMYYVVSYDSKYYWTDGIIEDVIFATSSKEEAEKALKRFKREATQTPWTGFYIKEEG